MVGSICGVYNFIYISFISKLANSGLVMVEHIEETSHTTKTKPKSEEEDVYIVLRDQPLQKRVCAIVLHENQCEQIFFMNLSLTFVIVCKDVIELQDRSIFRLMLGVQDYVGFLTHIHTHTHIYIYIYIVCVCINIIEICNYSYAILCNVWKSLLLKYFIKRIKIYNTKLIEDANN